MRKENEILIYIMIYSFMIGGVLMLILSAIGLYNIDISKEKIVEVECYDNKNNIIKGMNCFENKYEKSKNYGVAGISLGLFFIILGIGFLGGLRE